MAQRLSIHETEFLLKLLEVMETVGNTVVRTGSFRDAVADIEQFFTVHRPRMIDTTNKIRIVKDKVKTHVE